MRELGVKLRDCCKGEGEINVRVSKLQEVLKESSINILCFCPHEEEERELQGLSEAIWV